MDYCNEHMLYLHYFSLVMPKRISKFSFFTLFLILGSHIEELILLLLYRGYKHAAGSRHRKKVYTLFLAPRPALHNN